MEWEFCRYDILNDLSGQGLMQDIFIDTTDVSNNYRNPFAVLHKMGDIVYNTDLSLSIMREYADVFENKLNLDCQDKDDIYFYKGMIEDSYKYHFKSYSIKKKKAIFDLNEILKNSIFIKKGTPLKVINIDKKTINLFEESFNKIRDLIKEESNKKTKPIWIKDNHLERLENLTNEMIRIFKYHYEISLFFFESILREIQFYNINI